MKRNFVVVAVCLFVTVGAAAQADRGDGPVKIDLSTQFSSSIFAAHLSVTPSAVYRFGPLGVGAGIKTYVGLGHDAVYLGPYVRGEIGWFYLGAGPLVLLRQPTGSEWATFAEGLTVLVPAGAQIPLMPIGPGRLGVDLGAEFSLTPSKAIIAESDSIIGTILGSIVATTFGVVMNTIKLNVGLYYSFRL